MATTKKIQNEKLMKFATELISNSKRELLHTKMPTVVPKQTVRPPPPYEVAALKRSVLDRDMQLSVKETLLESKDMALSDSKVTIKKLDEKNTKLEAEVKDLRDERDTACTKLSKLNTKYNKLKKELASTKSELEKSNTEESPNTREMFQRILAAKEEQIYTATENEKKLGVQLCDAEMRCKNMIERISELEGEVGRAIQNGKTLLQEAKATYQQNLKDSREEIHQKFKDKREDLYKEWQEKKIAQIMEKREEITNGWREEIAKEYESKLAEMAKEYESKCTEMVAKRHTEEIELLRRRSKCLLQIETTIQSMNEAGVAEDLVEMSFTIPETPLPQNDTSDPDEDEYQDEEEYEDDEQDKPKARAKRERISDEDTDDEDEEEEDEESNDTRSNKRQKRDGINPNVKTSPLVLMNAWLVVKEAEDGRVLSNSTRQNYLGGIRRVWKQYGCNTAGDYIKVCPFDGYKYDTSIFKAVVPPPNTGFLVRFFHFLLQQIDVYNKSA